MEEKLYDEMFAVEHKHWWFKTRRYIVSNLIKSITKDYNYSILDCGCGCGDFLKEISHFKNVKGMDYNEKALYYTKKVFDGELKFGDLLDTIPFENNEFDIIVCLDVIEHIKEHEKALKELHRVLDKNGKMILTVPACNDLWSYHDELNGHERRYSLKELESVLENSNFNIEYITYYNTFLFIPIYIARKVNMLFKGNKNNTSDNVMPSNFINGILERIFKLEDKFIQKRYKMPIGVSLIALVTKK